MASSKDIELILKARLEQGDAITSANAIGKSIAETLESSFEGMGSKIAENLMKELEQKLSGFNFLDMGRKVTGSGMMEYDPNNMPSAPLPYHGASQEPVVKSMTHAAQQAVNSTVTDPGKTSRDNQFSTTNPANYSYGYGALGKLAEQTVANNVTLANRFGVQAQDRADFSDVEKGMIFRADSAINKFKAYETARSLGSKAPMEQFVSQDELVSAKQMAGSVATDAAKSLASLESKIVALQEALIGNERAVKEETNEKKRADKMTEGTKIRDELSQLDKQRTSATDRMEVAGGMSKTLDKISSPQAFSIDRMGINSGIAMLGAAGMGVNYYANRDIRSGQQAAGRADLEKFSGRDIASLDYNNIMATQMLGGEESMRQRARGNVVDRLGSSWATGLAEVGAGAAFGLSTGGMGWLPAAAAIKDGAGRLMDAHSGYGNMDAATAQEMRTLQALKIDENKDMMALGERGRGIYRNSFDTAASLGAKELAPWLTNRNGNLINASPNLSEGQVRSSMTQYAGNVGGVINGRNALNSPDVEAMLMKTFQLEGDGFTGATQSAANFYQGSAAGDQRGNASTNMANSGMVSNDIYDSLIKSGMDKSQADQLVQSASGMSTTGMGMIGTAKDYALSVGQGANQMGIHTRAGMEAVSRAEGNIRNLAVSGNGIFSIARARQIEDLEKKTKAKFTDEDKIALMNNTADNPGLADLIKRRGGRLDKDEEESVGNTFEKSVRDRGLGMEDSQGKAGGAIRRGKQGSLSNYYAVEQQERNGGDIKTLAKEEQANNAMSDEEKLKQFENKVNSAQVDASFGTMDKLMPTLNTNLETFVKHMADLNEQIKDADKLKDYKLPKNKDENFIPGLNNGTSEQIRQKLQEQMNNTVGQVRTKPSGSVA